MNRKRRKENKTEGVRKSGEQEQGVTARKTGFFGQKEKGNREQKRRSGADSWVETVERLGFEREELAAGKR